MTFGRGPLPKSGVVTFPQHVNFRVDAPLRAALSEYATVNGMTASQALRVLLALALRDEKDADPTFRAAAFREGVIMGLRSIRQQFATQIGAIVQQALSGMEE